SVIMVSDATAEYPAGRAMTYIYVENVDAAYSRAIALGCGEVMPPTDCDHGERMGGVTDHSGNQWWFGEPIRNTGKAK
ncbi:MAG TPA: VOC family protein, partial [Patescibacteria group bacterium]|nr:VOC family protein [Patescibacteria group bacterium]